VGRLLAEAACILQPEGACIVYCGVPCVRLRGALCVWVWANFNLIHVLLVVLLSLSLLESLERRLGVGLLYSEGWCRVV
jgi:hypothetical protein